MKNKTYLGYIQGCHCGTRSPLCRSQIFDCLRTSKVNQGKFTKLKGLIFVIILINYLIWCNSIETSCIFGAAFSDRIISVSLADANRWWCRWHSRRGRIRCRCCCIARRRRCRCDCCIDRWCERWRYCWGHLRNRWFWTGCCWCRII